MILNRFANTLVRRLFGIRYNDCTNTFQAYKRDTSNGLLFSYLPTNLTLELPLKLYCTWVFVHSAS